MRYGYRLIHILLKREGWQFGRNQTYRMHFEVTVVDVFSREALALEVGSRLRGEDAVEVL